MKKLLLVGLLILAPFSIATADLKVAVVDLGKVFGDFYKTKDAQAKLNEKRDGYTKEVQGYIDDYQRMGEEASTLEKASEDPTLSAQARQDRAAALATKKQDMLNLGNKIQELKVERGREIQEEMVRRHGEIVDEITKVISDYSGPQGYDLVIDKTSASAASGVSIVLYNSSKLIDITAEITKILNQSAPPASGTAQSATPAAATPAGP
jgi:outer membrane protein